MDKSSSPAGGQAGSTASDLDDAESASLTAPVVAVLVATGEATGLEATLESLGAQDYETLEVLVVDATGGDGIRTRVADVLPGAYVSSAPGSDFVEAANSVIGTVEGAAYLLFCRRGVVLESAAVRHLVEEAYRSNAGVVGPKVVDLNRPEIILEVGLAIDHYGVPFTGIEPSEIDQEQHDAVRDVFYVSSTTMLIRSDLFEDLGGFDSETFPGVFDLDICWRARLAGARVLAVPDARVRHSRSVHGAEVTLAYGANVQQVMRNRQRVLAKCYSGAALVWVIPVAAVLNLAEAVAFLFTRHRSRSRHVIGAWFANLANLRSVIAARREVQKRRRVGDREIRALMVRGSARLRTFFLARLRAGDRIQRASVSASRVAQGTGRRLGRAEGIAATVGLAILVLGSRSLLFGRVPEVGQFVSWVGAGDLWSSFWSGWRYYALGSPTAGPTAFGSMALASVVSFGSSDLARTVLIVGSIAVGVVGSYRLVRPLSASSMPAIAAAVAYGANPLARNLVAEGRLGSLVLYAVAPFLTATLFRGAADDDVKLLAPLQSWIIWLPGAMLLALATAFWVPALGYALLVGIAMLLAVPLVGGWPLARRVAVTAAFTTVAAVVLLVPWIFFVFDGDPAAFGLLPRRSLDLAEVLRFQTGPHGAGFAVVGLYAAAALALVVANGSRLAWAARAWLLVLASFALTWLPSRLSSGLAVPDPSGLLVPAAVGLSLAVGLSTAVFTEDLRRTLFGWRQFVTAAAVLAVALLMVPLLGATIDGDWELPNRDWQQALAWMEGQASESGRFRVLWLGDESVLPADPRVTGGIGWLMTRDGAAQARELFVAPDTTSTHAVEDAIGLAADGRTARLGRLLAPMGVRYVALIERPAPSAAEEVGADPVLADSLGEQLDLAQRQSESGMQLYENEAWASSLAMVSEASGGSVPTGEQLDPTGAALRADIEGADPVLGPLDGTEPTGPGELLWAESHDEGWQAKVDGESLESVSTFGWANGWDVPTRGSASVTYGSGIVRPLLIAVEALLWFAAAALLVRSGVQRRRSRREVAR